MKKHNYILILVFGFIIGFYTNSILLYEAPEQLINLGFTGRNTAYSIGSGMTYKTIVYFDGEKFDPPAVRARISRDFQIINTSKTTPMNLVFDNEELNSKKIYGEQEAFKTIFQELGTHNVYAQGIPGANLTITVVEDN